MIKKILATACLLLVAVTMFAQTKGDNKSVFFDISGGVSAINNSFTNTWGPSPSLQLNLRVPFYESQLEGGARYMRFNSEAHNQTDSDFHSTFLYLGWQYPISFSKRYTIAPLVRFGGNLMLFEEPGIITNDIGSQRFVTDTREIEFAYELGLRNQFAITEQWHLRATLSYNRTLTEFPLPVTMVSLGISYSFDQPNWLKQFLR